MSVESARKVYEQTFLKESLTSDQKEAKTKLIQSCKNVSKYLGLAFDEMENIYFESTNSGYDSNFPKTYQKFSNIQIAFNESMIDRIVDITDQIQREAQKLT